MSPESRAESQEPDEQVSGSRLSTLGSRLSGDSRLLILGMFLLAGVAAVLAIWYLRELSQRSMQFWGPTAGKLILQAPQVEILHLASGQRRDVSKARGLTNVRRALMQDASFAWNERSTASSIDWDYTLKFADGDRHATLLFAIDPPRAALEDAGEQLSTLPIARGLQAFFEEQFQPD